MSPTVLREKGYQVVIFTNDHPPAHVHVRHSGKVARVRLDPIEELHNQGFNTREMGVILSIVEENQHVLLEAWDAIHESRE
jgi:hypothetical protein